MESTTFNPELTVSTWAEMEGAVARCDPLSAPALITGSKQIALLISSLGTCIAFAASEINAFTGVLQAKLALLPAGAAPTLESLDFVSDREGRSALEREVWLLQVRFAVRAYMCVIPALASPLGL